MAAHTRGRAFGMDHACLRAMPDHAPCGGKATRLPNGTYLLDEDYTHLKLVRAPKWQANFTAEYTIPLGSAGDLTARGSVLYKSTYYNTVTNDVQGIAGDYTLVDASLNWTSGDGRYRLGVAARNLTDARYRVGGYNFPGALFGDSIIGYYGPPRTVTGTFEVKF